MRTFSTVGVSIITTCKGRLHHLRHSLPAMLGQVCSCPHEVVVVDYGCPDGTFDWCKTIGNQRLQAIRVAGDTGEFNRSHSRNIGAVVAQGRILAFVDADMRLHPRWLEAATHPIRGGQVGLTTVNSLRGDGWDRGGTCAVSVELFVRVRGYDEGACGWGAEDADFYQRCSASGTVGQYPANLLRPIKHGHGERVRFHAQKDLGASCRENQRRMAERAGQVNPNGFGLGEYEIHRGGESALPAVSWWNGERVRPRIRGARQGANYFENGVR